MPGSLVFGGGGDSSCATQTGTPDFVEAIAMSYDIPRLSCILGMAFGVSRSVVVVVVVVWVIAGRLREHRPARSGVVFTRGSWPTPLSVVALRRTLQFFRLIAPEAF